MDAPGILKSRRNPHDSLASLVARELIQRIDRGELRPGDRLPSERELMQTYGVSRTVVREATSSLRSAGRIATQQGRGAFVMASVGPVARPFSVLPAQSAASKDSQLAVLEVRIGLETEAAAQAARRRTPEALEAIKQAWQSLSIALDGGSSGVRRKDREFHLAIARATNNVYFADLLSSLTALPGDKPARVYVDLAARKLHLQQVRIEHEQIVRAIERRDPDAARAAMRIHLANSQERTAGVFDAAACRPDGDE
ncbi:FadR/GntR family transcriptional regulator [Uliginosibacterium sp. H3]|uniref:FadR/GntR family transcriptional regulator n=1 Tax=Uliginosibacterium silvisoli TaxID=3114758 RepID=A0ABU6K3E1_9RHOO|nr:FadR/GntR family transcriptional regulator [Uliginosibacterium sp. H3]